MEKLGLVAIVGDLSGQRQNIPSNLKIIGKNKKKLRKHGKYY